MTENRRRRRRAWRLGLVALIGSGPVAAQETLSLEQAVALALANSARVRSAEVQVERAENELQAARTRKRPTFNLQAQATQLLTPIEMTFPAGSFGVYSDIGPIPAADSVVRSSQQPSAWVSASVAQPITGLHTAGLSVAASRLTRDLDKQELREQKAAVTIDVRRLYYTVLQLGSALEAASEQAKALRELSQVVARYVSLETLLPQESMDVKAKLLAQEYRIVSLENAVVGQKQQLNVLFGREPSTPFAVVPLEAASAAEVDLETARARALASRPELAQARIQQELAETDRRLKKAESIPQLNLVMSYDSFFNTDLMPANLAQVGLQLKWEPFDWGRKKKQLASKTLAVDQAALAVRDQRHRVLAEVERAFRQVQEARALVAARRAGVDGSEERVRVALLQSRAQTLLVKDVLSAQAAAADARAQFDEAQLSLWQARADLDKAMGEEN